MSSFVDTFQDANVGVQYLLPGHGFDAKAAEERQAAAEEALRQQQQLVNQQTLANNQAAGRAAGYAQAGTNQGAGYLQQYGQSALNNIGYNSTRASGALYGANQDALRNLGQGYNQGRADFGTAQGQLASGYGQGLAGLGAAYGQGRSDLGQVAGLRGYAGAAASGIDPYDVTGNRSRLAELYDGGLGAGFQADPGYQFRQQQGEQAIMRAASAQGGRRGGATLKALADYNQNLASQEYDKYAQRQIGLGGAADQSLAALAMNQAGRADQAGLAQRGAQMQLAQAGLGAQSQLAQLAQGYGSQQAGMYAQQGQGLAGLSAQMGGMANQYGQNMAGQNNAYGSQLANLYQQTGQAQAGINQGMGSQLGNMYSQLGQAQGGYYMDAAGMNSQLTGGLMGQYNNPVQLAGDESQSYADQSRYGYSQLGPGNWFGMGGG